MPSRLARDLAQLHLVLTSRCNLRCAYCYQDAKRGDRMPWATARAALDLLLASRRREVEVVIFGGEPLLELPRIRRVLEHAERARPPGKRVRFTLSTNGLLLDRRAADLLSAHRVRTQISFDGVPEAQDLRSRGTFPALDGLLVRLRREHPDFFRDRVSVAVTVTPRSVPFLSRSVRYLLDRGVREIDAAPSVLAPARSGSRDAGRLDRELGLAHDASLEHFRRTGRIPLAILRRRARPDPKRRGGACCTAVRPTDLTVDTDGRVYGCVVAAESLQRTPDGPLGDDLRALRLGPLTAPEFPSRLDAYPSRCRNARLFRRREDKRSSKRRCRDCPALAECAFCPLSTARLPGNADPDRVPDFACDFNFLAWEWRQRFPPAPDPYAHLYGRAEVPGVVRRLL